MKCVDGPAAGKFLPVLLDPEKAVAGGSTLWPVLDLVPRPPDPPGLITRGDRDPSSHVARLNWYRIVKSGGGTFEARCDFHPDAEEYASKHRNPLTRKLPLILKELESLKTLMSSDIALVRKDHAAKKVHAGSAKVGEERYASVLAKHNAFIEQLIETLNGAGTPRARFDTQSMLREEDTAVDAFLAWLDQRDLPADVPIKPPVPRDRMEKMTKLLESARDLSSEYGALDDKAKTAMRTRLRSMAYESWPIKGD
ncbi:MAG: hypothetical protein U0797_00505 [Gemmataceae bacterium]